MLSQPPPLSPAARLTNDFDAVAANILLSEAIREAFPKLSCAAWAVAADHRGAAPHIITEIEATGPAQDRATRQALTRIVATWGAGDDEAVVEALRAWDRAGCERCALAVLDRSPCAHCGPLAPAGCVQ